MSKKKVKTVTVGKIVVENNVYGFRAKGKEFCETEGSNHYKMEDKKTESMDLIVSEHIEEGFCIGNIIKYASRFPKTQNLEDLKKIADYAHILCGIKLSKGKDEKAI
jgi:hypothetical protein